MGEERDALAGGAFAAGIVGQAFAISRLREETRQSVFADAAGACEEQGVRNAIGA
jgi:hypothetical protein